MLDLSLMKKRLRKKKHIGEFKKYGVQFSLKRATTKDFDAFLDVFLEEAIDANGCSFEGGGKDNKLYGYIELGIKDRNPEMKLSKIKVWMINRSDIENFVFGHVTDACYGPFDENNEIIKSC